MSRYSSSTFILIMITLLTVSLLQGCNKSDDGATPSEKNHSLVAARSYFEQNQYRAAIIEVRNALKSAPSDEAAELYAEIFIAVGQPKLASDFIEQYSPSSLKLSELLVKALIDQKKYISAKSALGNFNAETLPEPTLQLLKTEIAAGLDDFELAEKELSVALDKFPDSEKARILQLKIATLQNDQASANEAIKALKLSTSESPNTFITLAQIAASQDDYNQAEQYLMKSLRYLPSSDVMTPEKSTTLLLLIKTLTSQGRYADAVPYSQLLSKTNPDWQRNKEKMEKAIKDLENGDIALAEAAFLEMQEAQQDNPQASAMLGLIHLQRGDAAKAAQLFSNNLDPEVAPTVFTTAAAMSLLKTNEYEDAIDILEKALQANPKETKLLALYGLALIKEKSRYAEGIKSLQKAVEIDPQNSQNHIALAEGYYAGNQLEKGKTALLAAYDVDKSNAISNLHISNKLLDSKQNDAALAFAQTIVNNDKENAANWITKGITETRLERVKDASRSFDRAIKVNTELFDAHFYRALLAVSQQNWQTAEKHFRDAITLRNTSIEAYTGLFNSIEASKGKQAAIDAFNEIAKKEEHQLSALLILANNFQRAGDSSMAQKTFARIDFMQAKETPSQTAPMVQTVYSSIVVNKTRDHIEKKEENDAIQTLESALKHYPSSVFLLRFAASSYVQLNKLGEAAAIANELKKLNQDVFSTLIEVDILAAQKDFKPALTLLKQQWKKQPATEIGKAIMGISARTKQSIDPQFITQWKALFPANDTPYLFEADTYLKKGDGQNAIAQYAALLKYQPNHVQALNNITWLSYEAGNMEQALEYADKAYQAAPNNPNVLDTVGWVKVEAKQKEGLTILEKAAKLAPENKAIQEHLTAARKMLSQP